MKVETEAFKSIPNVREWPLVGSALVLQKDTLRFLINITSECGEAGRYHIGPFKGIVFNTPEAAQAVLVKHADDFDTGTLVHRISKYTANKGLFLLEGEAHRRQRKLVAPHFQPRHLSNYAEAMVSFADQAQKRWQEGVTIDIQKEMTAITMRIVGKVLFDTEFLSEADDLGAAVNTLLKYNKYLLTTIFPLPLSTPIPRIRKARKALELITRRLQAMISERRVSKLEDKIDLLSMLIKTKDDQGNEMSEKQVQDEAVTFFVAGHETTALALAWTVYLLITNSNSYTKLQEEVDQILQGRLPTYSDLGRLPYSLMVIKEALRLYPSSVAVPRQALRDVNINGYALQKGELVLISIFTMHRSPVYFPRPEGFDPERFTPNNEKILPRYAYIPFGAGPRTCIGNHFALMEAQLVLVTLMQRVEFSLIPGQAVTPKAEFFLRQKNGCKVRVKHRI